MEHLGATVIYTEDCEVEQVEGLVWAGSQVGQETHRRIFLNPALRREMFGSTDDQDPTLVYSAILDHTKARVHDFVVYSTSISPTGLY